VGEKMVPAEEHRGSYGLNQTLGVLGLSKGNYYYRRHHKSLRQDADEQLKERIVSVIEENPSYGYRRISTPNSPKPAHSWSTTSASGGSWATTNWDSGAACRGRDRPRRRE
jgi:hypothetical protein